MKNKIDNTLKEISKIKISLLETRDEFYRITAFINKKLDKVRFEYIEDIQDELKELNKEISFLYLVVIFLLIINFILICAVF